MTAAPTGAVGLEPCREGVQERQAGRAGLSDPAGQCGGVAGGRGGQLSEGCESVWPVRSPEAGVGELVVQGLLLWVRSVGAGGERPMTRAAWSASLTAGLMERAKGFAFPVRPVSRISSRR